MGGVLLVLAYEYFNKNTIPAVRYNLSSKFKENPAITQTSNELYSVVLKVSKLEKISNEDNQVLHLTQDTTWESDKTNENVLYKRAKRLALGTARIFKKFFGILSRFMNLKGIKNIHCLVPM